MSDQMTLMPLDCRAIWVGGGGVWRSMGAAVEEGGGVS